MSIHQSPNQLLVGRAQPLGSRDPFEALVRRISVDGTPGRPPLPTAQTAPKKVWVLHRQQGDGSGAAPVAVFLSAEAKVRAEKLLELTQSSELTFVEVDVHG